jgi:hypothetical protein
VPPPGSRRSLYAFLADHRHQLFPSELFADVVRQGGGHPSVPAEVVATVMVLQALEGLSDREAISALRRDIVWKVVCGLRLDDEGFHPTVLVYWRDHIRTSPRPRRILQAVRLLVAAKRGAAAVICRQASSRSAPCSCSAVTAALLPGVSIQAWSGCAARLWYQAGFRAAPAAEATISQLSSWPGNQPTGVWRSTPFLRPIVVRTRALKPKPGILPLRRLR